jgi:hypothetical protein
MGAILGGCDSLASFILCMFREALHHAESSTLGFSASLASLSNQLYLREKTGTEIG